MNRREKETFIYELINSVQLSVMQKVELMPEAWDGHELRRYIADKFAESAMTVGRPGQYGKPYAKRFRDYKNEVIVRNL